MFNHPEIPSETDALEEVQEFLPPQRVITIAQILKEGKPTKYVLMAGEQIIECVEGFEHLVEELLTAFDELTPESELGAATF